MSASDLKLELFRRIDSLNEDEVKKVYHKILSLLKTIYRYQLSHPFLIHNKQLTKKELQPENTSN